VSATLAEGLARFALLMGETREGCAEWAAGAVLLLCGGIVMLSRLPANRVAKRRNDAAAAHTTSE
jgi:hypothetical protein